jgi:Ni,Fe-hydrogenase III large subunit
MTEKQIEQLNQIVEAMRADVTAIYDNVKSTPTTEEHITKQFVIPAPELVAGDRASRIESSIRAKVDMWFDRY